MCHEQTVEPESWRLARAARRAGRGYDTSASGTTRAGGRLMRCKWCSSLQWERDLIQHFIDVHGTPLSPHEVLEEFAPVAPSRAGRAPRRPRTG